MTERLNTTDLAAEFNLSHGRTAALLRVAGVERDGSKLYDASEARAVLSAAIDPARATGNRIAGRAGGAVAPEISALAAAKLETERARTRKMTLENDVRTGKLIDRALVTEAGEDFAATVRTSIMAVAPKIAARLVGKTRDEIAGALEVELRYALTDLSDVTNYILGGAP